MAQMSNDAARSYIANSLDIDVSAGDGPTNVLQAMNLGGLRVWEARPWFGRRVEADLSTERRVQKALDDAQKLIDESKKVPALRQ